MATDSEGKRTCIFCRTGAVSREHVWPEWVREAVYARFGKVKWEAIRDNKKFPVPKLEAVVKRVCETCNNGWMSALEVEAKPLLMPMMFGDFPTVERSPAEQEIIAKWAMKTALVADFFSTRRNFAPHLAAELYQTKRPPPRSYIYMAAYQGVKMPLRSYLFVTKMTFR